MDVKILNNPAVCTYEQVAQLCEPIFNLFNLTFFRYLRVFPDGSRIHLCSNPTWTEHFYSKQYYKIAWFDANKIEYPKNIEIIWDEKAKREDNDVGIEARTYFNIYHGISIIRPGSGYYEVFDFATEKNNAKINDIYLNNLPLFERFFFYFRDRGNPLIQEAYNQRIKPLDLMKKWNPDVQNSNQKTDSVEKFLKQTQTKRYYINISNVDVYLTRKEVECIYWAVLGKSAEEIGMISGSSKRTTEIHLNNIKKKLMCSKISQVIKIVVDSGLLEAFKFNLN
jgi:DNA-binding CsgD family transcriptional regulator